MEQKELMESKGPYRRIDVWMRPVSQRTKRIKEPRTTTPGSKDRWEMRIRIMRRKIRAREDVAISNGKSLFYFYFIFNSLSLVFYFLFFIFL